MNTTFYKCDSVWRMSRPVLWVIGFSLFLRLILIQLNGGEYTDGIIQLQLWDSPVVFFPPGYSALAWVIQQLGADLLLAGRLVSVLASGLALVSFHALARQVLRNDAEVFWAVLFLALSPIFNRWSLRVMTDSLFCFFFIACCREFLLAWENRDRSLSRLLVWTGLAALVRYQGLYFLLFVPFLLWKDREVRLRGVSFKDGIGFLSALVPWLALGYWIALRGFGHHEQFLERGSMGFWITLSAYYSMFETYILYWPWALTFGLFLLGVMGCVPGRSAAPEYKSFLWFSAGTALVFLLVQSAFLSFQYRYLLPLVPLWCLAAARGWGVCRDRLPSEAWRTGIMAIVLINAVLMTGAVLVLQRGTFGDLAKSAEALKVIGRGARVVSDEVYRQGVYNVKMRFWSGREMEYYHQTELKEGDLVVLHNSYSDMEKEAEKIGAGFDYTVIGRWQSQSLWGPFTTLPLLPDIMVFPSGVPLTSNPPCMAFRFVPQHYVSVLLRLEKKKG